MKIVLLLLAALSAAAMLSACVTETTVYPAPMGGGSAPAVNPAVKTNPAQRSSIINRMR